LIHIGVSTETVVSCALRIEVRAVGDGGVTGDSIHGRANRRVREIELCRFDLRLPLVDRRRGLLVLALRVIEVLLRQRVLFRERLGAREVLRRHLQCRLVAL
jgi:hypothetical protein